jgi:hypothetical protein
MPVYEDRMTRARLAVEPLVLVEVLSFVRG